MQLAQSRPLCLVDAPNFERYLSERFPGIESRVGRSGLRLTGKTDLFLNGERVGSFYRNGTSGDRHLFYEEDAPLLIPQEGRIFLRWREGEHPSRQDDFDGAPYHIPFP